jgi:hypothetical protein
MGNPAMPVKRILGLGSLLMENGAGGFNTVTVRALAIVVQNNVVNAPTMDPPSANLYRMKGLLDG